MTGSGSSTLTVTTTGSTPVGTSTLTITGTSGALTHSTTVSLVVSTTATTGLHDAASPGTQTVGAGTSTTYTATIGALNGFAGVVTLSASGMPTGTTASLFTGDGDGSGKFDTDGNDDEKHACGDIDADDHGNERERDTHGDGEPVGDDASDESDQHRLCWARDGDGEYGSGRRRREGELEQCEGLTNTTGQALVDETGTATGSEGYMEYERDLEPADHGYAGRCPDDAGVPGHGGGVTTVTVTGLASNAAGYDVYVYADGDDAMGTDGAYTRSAGQG